MVCAPIVTVVSCGNNDAIDNHNNFNPARKELLINLGEFKGENSVNNLIHQLNLFLLQQPNSLKVVIK